jgi:hypothetical protein
LASLSLTASWSRAHQGRQITILAADVAGYCKLIGSPLDRRSVLHKPDRAPADGPPSRAKPGTDGAGFAR